MARAHKDVEFAVDDAGGRQHNFRRFEEAAAFAVSIAAATGRKVNLDVLIWSAAGAYAWAGSEGAERYAEDPDASVFERAEIRAHFVGRVP